jgi:GNAT superfamily N-acetyltransferase
MIRNIELTPIPWGQPWAVRPEFARELSGRGRRIKQARDGAKREAMFHEGYSDLRPGQIGSIVTYLEMCQRPPRNDSVIPADLRLRRVENPNLKWYRELFRTVGSNWLWFSRLKLDDDELAAIISDPMVLIFALEHCGRDRGLLELDCRCRPEIEISFLGVVEELIGRGAGKFLLNQALSIAWSFEPKRIVVHTCTLDHPNALSFYRAAGFETYKRAVEVSADPRLTGIFSVAAAPGIPIIRQGDST